MDNNLQQSPSTVRKDIFVMIGEIVILCVIFLFSLILLNYFHILNIGKSFTYLNFLPHIKNQSGFTEVVPLTPIPKKAAIITPIVYGIDDENKAKASLQSFIQSILLPSFLSKTPLTFTIIHNLNMHIFSTLWQNNQNSYLVTLHEGYQGNPTITKNISLFIIPSRYGISNNTISGVNAGTLLPLFVRTSLIDKQFQCSNTTEQNIKIQYCQTTVSLQNSKNVYGIFGNSGNLTVYVCDIPQNSPYYTNNGSCFTEN